MMIAAKDVKAVENPISAMFDLADDVYDQAPHLKKMVWYAIFFIGIWWLVNLILTIILIVTPPFIWGFLMLVLLITGLLALRMLFKTKDFLNYYEQRHKAVQVLRNANPETKIPEGKTPVERIIKYLRERNSSLRDAERKGGVLRGKDAAIVLRGGIYRYELDAHMMRHSSLGWRLLDWGDMGYAFYLKSFDAPPTLDDIKKLEMAVVNNTKKTGTPPSRVIALLPAGAEDKISDELYEYVTSHAIKTEYMMSSYYCTVQIVTEGTDGEYDFIPFVVDN